MAPQNNSWPQRLLAVVTALEDWLLAGMLLAMVILGSLQIVLRNFFESGIAWGDPLLRVMVLWVGLLGAMAATRDDRHIRIDILTRYLPEKWQGWNQVVIQLFTAAVCALVAWHGLRFVQFEREDGMTSFADIPSWWLESIIPVGFALIAVRSLLTAWRHLMSVAAGRP